MNARHTSRLAAVCLTALLASSCALLPDSVTGLGDRMVSQQKRISADFENVAGLYPGNEVSVLGVPGYAAA